MKEDELVKITYEVDGKPYKRRLIKLKELSDYARKGKAQYLEIPSNIFVLEAENENHELNYSMEKTQEIVKELLEKDNVKHAIVFSGESSYHLWIALDEEIDEDKRKDIFKYIKNRFREIKFDNSSSSHKHLWPLAGVFRPSRNNYTELVKLFDGNPLEVNGLLEQYYWEETNDNKNEVYRELKNRFSIAEIVKIIGPYWTDGKRNEILLYLTGYLVKSGLLQGEGEVKVFVKKLLEELPTNHPKKKFYTAIYTYRRWKENPEKIAGISKLKELLNEESIRELKDIINPPLFRVIYRVKIPKSQSDDFVVVGIRNRIRGDVVYKVLRPPLKKSLSYAFAESNIDMGKDNLKEAVQTILKEAKKVPVREGISSFQIPLDFFPKINYYLIPDREWIQNEDTERLWIESNTGDYLKAARSLINYLEYVKKEGGSELYAKTLIVLSSVFILPFAWRWREKIKIVPLFFLTGNRNTGKTTLMELASSFLVKSVYGPERYSGTNQFKFLKDIDSGYIIGIDDLENVPAGILDELKVISTNSFHSGRGRADLSIENSRSRSIVLFTTNMRSINVQLEGESKEALFSRGIFIVFDKKLKTKERFFKIEKELSESSLPALYKAYFDFIIEKGEELVEAIEERIKINSKNSRELKMYYSILYSINLFNSFLKEKLNLELPYVRDSRIKEVLREGKEAVRNLPKLELISKIHNLIKSYYYSIEELGDRSPSMIPLKTGEKGIKILENYKVFLRPGAEKYFNQEFNTNFNSFQQLKEELREIGKTFDYLIKIKAGIKRRVKVKEKSKPLTGILLDLELYNEEDTHQFSEIVEIKQKRGEKQWFPA